MSSVKFRFLIAPRNRCGALTELCICRLPERTPLQQIVAVDQIRHRQPDSLYIEDETTFFHVYGDIFGCGIYNNLLSGPPDPCGINYYPPSRAEEILAALSTTTLPDSETLAAWLRRVRQYNGFYLLGL